MSTLETLHLIWHILLAVLSAVAAGCLISRHIQLKMAGKRSGFLFWWSLGLTFMAIYCFWLIIWDFPELFKVNLATVQLTMLFARFVLIPLCISCFALPVLKLIVKTSLFGPLILIFMVMIFCLVLLMFFSWQNPQIFTYIEPLSIYSFGFLAPANLFLAFLFLFLFLTMIGPHFWRIRAAGFLMIVFAFFTLAAMNIARYWLVEVASSWESSVPAPLPSLSFIMQFSREVGYLILVLGFYLATMPRVIRRYDHTKLVEMDHQKVVEAKAE